ncbi:MAG: condensation domain-containing protein [Micromonosporaceae bacterium]
MADLRQRTAPPPYQQERIYLFEGLDSGSCANNLAFLHWIDGDLDRPALAGAVAELHRRHEIRRTRHPNGASQGTSISDGYRLPFSDLGAGADPAGEVRRLLDESVNRRFDLAAEAPLRWTLYALGPGRHALTLVVHHIAFDAWSKAVIDTELSGLYRVFHTGAERARGWGGPRYAGTATRQRDRTEPERRADLDQWVRALAGAPSTLRLPFDRHPRAGIGYGDAGGAPVPEPLMREVERLGGRAGASASMVLFAALAGLLARHGGQPNMVIRVPTAGRGELGPETLVGGFVDTVPLRIRLAGPDTAALRPDREPVVQVVFQVNNAPAEPLRLTGLTVTGESPTPISTDVGLTIMIGDDPGSPVGQWRYRTELFDAGAIEDLRQYFQRVLDQVVADLATPLADLLDLPATAPVDTADLRPYEEVGDRTVPPGTTEQAVAALFTELLGLERIGVEDNFFALGGHSLLAARLVALVRKDFQVGLTLLDLFEKPTVAGVTAFIEGVTGAVS